MSVETVEKAPVYDNREAFAEELIALAEADERIVVVCNDSVGSSKLGEFQKRFPDRLINVGIAEQDMVGIGAGLANGGMIPFVCSAAPFLTGRATEQIKADVAYSQYPVILCGMSPGMAYGQLGPTHHSIEDLSWMRALPGLDIVLPADREETRQVMRLLAESPRPTYMRIGRFAVPDVNPADAELERGRWSDLTDGSDVTVFAVATMVSRALEAAELLRSEGLSTRVVNAAWLAPLDEAAVEKAASSSKAIVTAEEANVAGGLGAAVASIVAQRPGHRVPVRILGINEFAPTGSNPYLLEHFGLTAEGIAAAALEAVSNG